MGGNAVSFQPQSGNFLSDKTLNRCKFFDLVVTDINMPDINGLELVSFMKSSAKYRSIPLIIVSTERSERDRDKGLGLGANAYVVKPFEPEALREVARNLLAGAGTRE